MHDLYVLPECEKEIKKLTRRNKALKNELRKKLSQILKDPDRFKPLKKPLAGLRRVHVGKVFVLLFQVSKNRVVLVRFKHHDEVYK